MSGFSGSSPVAGIFYGADGIKEVYKGSDLLWSKSTGWPRSGAWNGNAVPGGATIGQFTVTEAGMYTASYSVTTTQSGNVVLQATIYVNETSAATGNIFSSGPATSTATMAPRILQPGDVVSFRYVSLTGSPAITTEWTADFLGEANLPMMLELNSATLYPYRVAFAGSSTMQGWNQPRYESVAHVLTARLVRHPLGANASQMVSKTTGSQSGPTAPGFHFLNAGLGGTTSANYLDTTKRNLVNSFSPQLLIHMVGSNDYSEQMAPATYKTNMRNAINSIGTSTTKHVLVHQQRREDRSDTGNKWADYGAKLQELSQEMSNVFFVDASQRWHDLRNGATDWFAADKIHCTWKGAQGLATAIANAMQLEEHVGKTVWAATGSRQSASNAYVSSITPEPESLALFNATAPSSSVQPYIQTNTGKPKSIEFAGSGLRHADTSSWYSAYTFPMTFYVVQKEFSASNDTAVCPWFSRSVMNDDGWWWVWRDRNSTEIRAALNSAFSDAANYGVNNMPAVFAVHMTANSRATIWVSSTQPFATLGPDRIDENPGPWMKSLRLNANSSLASYGSHRFFEIRFELGNYDTSQVGQRVAQLGAKYGITIY